MIILKVNPKAASKIFADEYSIKILAASSKRPRTVQQLSKVHNISIANCLRKIHELEDSGLIACVDKMSIEGGRRVNLYRSQLKGAYFFFENGKLKVQLSLTRDEDKELNEVLDIIND